MLRAEVSLFNVFSVYEVIRVASRVVALFYTPRQKPLQRAA